MFRYIVFDDSLALSQKIDELMSRYTTDGTGLGGREHPRAAGWTGTGRNQ
jgi:hypothetical protein